MSSELSTSRYTANYDDKAGLYALSKTDGAVAWPANVAATITGRPVVAEEAVLVPTDDGVRCVDPADGSQRWVHSDMGTRRIAVEDLVYAVMGSLSVRPRGLVKHRYVRTH